MEKKVSVNQASLLLVIFTVALKLSVLPTIMNSIAYTSSYISCLIALTIDFLCTLLIISIMIKIPSVSFFELLERAFHKVVAIMVYALLFIYFFVKLTISLTEIHDYYTSSLFEDLNPYFALIVLFFLILYILLKDFRTLGRLLEIFFWPIVIEIGFTLIFPFSDIEISNLLPLFTDGAYPILKAVYRTSLAFGDFMLLIVLMGKISYRENAKKKILLYAVNAMWFIFNFYVVFVGAFGNTTVNQTLALGELPMHNSLSSAINRLEWLTIIVWTALMFINTGILGKCCSDCFRRVFNSQDNKVPAIVISILVIVTQVFSVFRINFIAKLGTSPIISTITIIFYTLILLLLVIGYLRIKGKDRSKVSKQQKSTRSKTDTQSDSKIGGDNNAQPI